MRPTHRARNGPLPETGKHPSASPEVGCLCKTSSYVGLEKKPALSCGVEAAEWHGWQA